MNDFENMRIEFWVDGGRNVCALRAGLPKDPELISSRHGYERYAGLGHIWFILNEDELRRFATDSQCQFEDGVHRMDVVGDTVMFYDAVLYQDSVVRKKYGVASVAYYNASIPAFFRKLLYRVARKIWAGLRKAGRELDEYARRDQPRVELNFDLAYRQRIERLYGQGKGNVRLDFADYRGDECRHALETGDEKLKESLDYVTRIARNTTRGRHQTASLGISIDGHHEGKVEGFYWVARDPNGRAIMNGAMVDRGNEWSIHT